MKTPRLATMLAAAFVLCFTAAAALGQDVPRIGKDELKAKLGSPDLVLMDVRTSGDWKFSEVKIKGAIRPDYLNKKAEDWASDIPKDKEIVLY